MGPLTDVLSLSFLPASVISMIPESGLPGFRTGDVVITGAALAATKGISNPPRSTEFRFAEGDLEEAAVAGATGMSKTKSSPSPPDNSNDFGREEGAGAG